MAVPQPFEGRLIATLLFGVEPRDMMSFALAAFTLSIAGLIAAYLPARRAAKVAPASALRAE
ncbi:MAG: hypothetical protein JJE39_09930 [Vicinamibacteria bacterium]|nr:hypothetical protein [Vicinamibacteria bacterium]